ALERRDQRRLSFNFAVAIIGRRRRKRPQRRGGLGRRAVRHDALPERDRARRLGNPAADDRNDRRLDGGQPLRFGDHLAARSATNTKRAGLLPVTGSIAMRVMLPTPAEAKSPASTQEDAPAAPPGFHAKIFVPADMKSTPLGCQTASRFMLPSTASTSVVVCRVFGSNSFTTAGPPRGWLT